LGHEMLEEQKLTAT
ncbi:Hypothetical protein F387_00001, partial [Wohlfahrtiimonas chitiniclastica SH04]